jgi:hypothetical protein
LQARSAGVSTYEVIRHTLEKEIDQDPVANAQAFYSEGYVRDIRSKGLISPMPTLDRKPKISSNAGY